LHALEVYSGLLALNREAVWQLPLQYQVGLVYEHLEQPVKATDAYAAILARENELNTNSPLALKTTLEMAKWRKDFVAWNLKAIEASRELSPARRQSPTEIQ